jgi:putative DNA primase/helicase
VQPKTENVVALPATPSANANGNAAADVGPLAEIARRPLTDLGNTERLVALHGADLRYVPQTGWHAWDGSRWRRDLDGEVVRRMKTTVRAISAAAADCDLEPRRKELLKHAFRSESEASIRKAIVLAESERELVVDVSQLDRNPMLLNVANGTVHLEAGELTEHSRDDLITKVTPIALDHDAEAPRWRAFLEQILAGDQELIAYVQRAVGYSLTGSTQEQVLFLLDGGGANGKSTFIETLRSVLGDYGQQAPPEMFLAQRGDRIKNELARLPGARFVAAVETGDGRLLDETLVKTLTGGDTMTARPLYRDHFEFTPAFKAWIATNHKPDIRGTDEAIWRRIHLIPFNVTIPKVDRDPHLTAKLRAEASGILAWAIEGCLAWQYKGGLNPPAVVLEATRSYRRDQDTVGEFLDDCCTIAAEHRVTASRLYNRYCQWVENAGDGRKLSAKALAKELDRRGFKATRDNQARWRTGLALVSDERDA